MTLEGLLLQEPIRLDLMKVQTITMALLGNPSSFQHGPEVVLGGMPCPRDLFLTGPMAELVLRDSHERIALAWSPVDYLVPFTIRPEYPETLHLAFSSLDLVPPSFDAGSPRLSPMILSCMLLSVLAPLRRLSVLPLYKSWI
jgi:hypothetical protein